MVVVHHFLEEIVDVEFGSAIHDSLHFVEQFLELQALCVGDVVECHLAVNALDDLHLHGRFLSHRSHTQVLGALNLVFLTMALDEFHKFLTEFLCLSGTYALHLLQFLQCDGIHRGHLFQRTFLEHGIRGHPFLLGNLLAEVFQHHEKFVVECAALSFHGIVFIVFVEVVVEHNHKRVRRLQEFLSCGGHLEQSVVLHVLLQITGNESLADDGIPNLPIQILTGAELFQLVVLVSNDVVGGTARDEVDDIVCPEILFHFQNGRKYDLQGILGLLFRFRMQTVVAVSAVFHGIFLTEIVQQHLAATDRRLGIGSSLGQQLSADILLCHRLTLHKLLQFLEVFVTVESDTFALTAVASGTTGFLIVAFQTLRDVVVDDKAHIGLVDTHAKRDGSHNHIDILLQEIVLRLTARTRIESGMIGSRLDVIGTEHGGQFLHLLARETVDNATLARYQDNTASTSQDIYDEEFISLINCLSDSIKEYYKISKHNLKETNKFLENFESQWKSTQNTLNSLIQNIE